MLSFFKRRLNLLYKYKVTLPTKDKDVLEFESEHHISSLSPLFNVDGVYAVHFEDADVVLNLAQMPEIEIDGIVVHLSVHN